MHTKLISISLSPNVFPEDISAAKTMFSQPSALIHGADIARFQETFSRYLDVEKESVFLFNSGRSALVSLLKAFDINEGDEVLLQAFTCNAVPNPVLWVRATPVYVDVNAETYNIDVTDLEKKITPRAKAIIVQHTFGQTAPLKEILAIARERKLIVIEDCAHALGATHDGKLLGTFGDGAFFSFGRDKVISSVYGGAAILKLQTTNYKLQTIYNELPYPSVNWVKQQLRHPILMEKLLRWYNTPLTNYGIGKFLLQCSQATRFLSKAVHWKEKVGKKPDYFPARLPNALAHLALLQFERLDAFNSHRRELAEFYFRELQTTNYKLQTLIDGHIYLRYPVRHPDAHEIIRRARKQGILLGDWYNSVVAPDDTNLENMQYKNGSCPTAERLTKETFNLPTNPNLSIDDAKRAVEFLKGI